MASLIILLLTLSIASSESQYVIPDRYFINCGSNSDITYTGKKFFGDENSPTFSFSVGRKALNNNPTYNTSEIYQTARVFTEKSWYVLESNASNTFVMINLHFSPFFCNGSELSDSKFDVSVSGFSLLSNFNVGNLTVIKNFIIPIGKQRKLIIEFTPSSGSSSSFVNAIEAFTTPSKPFMCVAPSPHISSVGYIGETDDISSSYAFNPIYRINVGGPDIDVERDTLRRNWIPDDPFIFKSEPAKNVTLPGTFNHNQYYATRYDAPGDVYNTAKTLNPNSSSVNNITWNFMVNKNATYLVRAHFCDIISTAVNNSKGAFNFFIYSHYKKEINPIEKVEKVQKPQIPFYYDFVVDSVESGFVNISIGAIPGNSQPVLLNGLEIMELLKYSGVGDVPKNLGVGDTQNGGKISKKVYIVVGVVVFVLLIGSLLGFINRTELRLGTKTGGNCKTWSNTNLKDPNG